MKVYLITETPNGIKIKDKVRLIEGGTIEMLVGMIQKTNMGFLVTCHWEEKGRLKTQNFLSDVLEKAG